MLKVGIIGYTGRMGKEICKILAQDDSVSEIIGCISKNNDSQNIDFTENKVNNGYSKIVNNKIVKVSDEIGTIFESTDVVIDFSSPIGFEQCINYCTSKKSDTKYTLISGSTGVDKQIIRDLQNNFPNCESCIFWSANTSIGINLIIQMLKSTKFDILKNYEYKLSEIHHIHKKDSPSGTSLLLADALDIKYNDSTAANFCCERIGETIGVHEMSFSSGAEKISIKHEATARSLFAKGAVDVMHWLRDMDKGFYTMEDFINC